MFSAREIFDIAIRLEENGERLYREALAYVSDQPVREMLAWLADQEDRHQDRFRQMKSSIKAGENVPWAEEMGRAILEGAVEHHAFSLEEVNFKSVANEAELIKVALEFENDGVLFYEILGSFVTDPDTLGQLAEIIAEERKHIQLLDERQRTLEELKENR
jgi:rubrerythrin